MESIGNLERWKEEMPTEGEMRPKDKYTMFDRKEKNYRKGVHSESNIVTGAERGEGYELMLKMVFPLAELPKWTRVSQRINPPGF